MGVASVFVQEEVAVVGGFDGEGESAVVAEHTPGRGEHRRKVAEIDEHIGGENEVVAIVGSVEMCDDVADAESIVHMFGFGLGDDFGRQVDAVEPTCCMSKRFAGQAGAASSWMNGKVVVGCVPNDGSKFVCGLWCDDGCWANLYDARVAAIRTAREIIQPNFAGG